MPIETREDLKSHVELAVQVELFTIPPYLYSMYSIEDQTSEAALLLRSIVVEEMLHAALATNLLLALGGQPDFRSTRYMPQYPSPLPHHQPPLVLDLAPASHRQITDVFMRIEQPELHGSPAQPDEFETLGQFYHALEQGIEKLDGRFDLFEQPHTAAQLSDASYYRPVAFDAEDSGGLVEITDLKSAIDAIEIIVHQGEGMSDERWADPAHQELTHYYKLLQISEGGSPLGNVRNLPVNPHTADYPMALRPVSDLFNAIYRSVYLVLGNIFSGDGDQRKAVGVLYLLMADVMPQVARFLVQHPLDDERYAAPTFERYEFSDEPLTAMNSLSEAASATFPELATVREAIRGLSLIL